MITEQQRKKAALIEAFGKKTSKSSKRSKRSNSNKEDTKEEGGESLTTRKSSTRIKPKKQNTAELIDTIFGDSTEVATIRRKADKEITIKGYKRDTVKKSWAQNIVEQIILFYKVIIFHQSGLRYVLDLIKTIAKASDSEIDEIVMMLKTQAKKDKKKKGGDPETIDNVEEVVDSDAEKWQDIRADSAIMDSEEREQSARRVRALISTRRVRLLYYLLYYRYRVTPNEIVRVKKNHPLKTFLTHFNKFIDNKGQEFIKSPTQPVPKNEAKEIGQTRKDLVDYAGADMSDWEKMYLMSVLLNKGKSPGLFATSGGLLANFGSIDDLDDDFKFLQREVYEFTCERLLLVLFDDGFKMNHKNLKTFVDQYSIISEREESDRERTTSERAEDYITQMQVLIRVMKGGLFDRPIMNYKGGEKVYEYVLHDAYVTRPVQILKEIPDYPEYLRKLSEALDRKTWLVNKCGAANNSCMPELSIGRVMYFIMTHLILIHRILQRLATERLTAASDSLKFTKKKGVTDALFKFQNESVPLPFNPNAPNNAATGPIYYNDLYTMAILDSENWSLSQKSDNDVLVGFLEPRVMKKVRWSRKEDPHEREEEKIGLVPNMLEYNDLENLLYRVFRKYKEMNTRIKDYEKVFLSLSLSKWGRFSKLFRPSITNPMRSVTQKNRYYIAKKKTKKFIEDMSFGILTNKVNKYGVEDTVRYFSELNKKLTVEQKKKNAKYLALLINKV